MYDGYGVLNCADPTKPGEESRRRFESYKRGNQIIRRFWDNSPFLLTEHWGSTAIYRSDVNEIQNPLRTTTFPIEGIK